MNLFKYATCILVPCFFFTLGCHKVRKPDGFPPVYPCTVKLLQEGRPLAGAEVILASKDDSCRWSVGGTTGNDGVATIMTHGRFAGAPEGTFVVTVSKTEAENANQGEFRTKPIKIYTFVDKKYTNRDTSTLEITIEKGKNRKEFELGPFQRVLSETISPTGA